MNLQEAIQKSPHKIAEAKYKSNVGNLEVTLIANDKCKTVAKFIKHLKTGRTTGSTVKKENVSDREDWKPVKELG